MMHSHACVEGLPLKIYKYVIERAPPNSVDVILSYCHNSLNDQSLAELIPYLKDKDIGIISASPLSMGLFTSQVCSTSPAPCLRPIGGRV